MQLPRSLRDLELVLLRCGIGAKGAKVGEVSKRFPKQEIQMDMHLSLLELQGRARNRYRPWRTCYMHLPSLWTENMAECMIARRCRLVVQLLLVYELFWSSVRPEERNLPQRLQKEPAPKITDHQTPGICNQGFSLCSLPFFGEHFNRLGNHQKAPEYIRILGCRLIQDRSR